MNQFDPTPNPDRITRTDDAYKRETVGVTPARIGWGIAAVVAVLFVIQNNEQVPFKFLFGLINTEMALWLLLVIALALGFALGYLAHSLRSRRRARG